MALSQTEYDFLMVQEKRFDDAISPIRLGPSPIHWTRILVGKERKETFVLDFYRGSFELSKYTFNKRYRQTTILLRFDKGGRHTNPDGELLEGPHIHLYREGYNDKFAFPINSVGIDEEDCMATVFNKIMQICNVKKIPGIEIPMF